MLNICSYNVSPAFWFGRAQYDTAENGHVIAVWLVGCGGFCSVVLCVTFITSPDRKGVNLAPLRVFNTQCLPYRVFCTHRYREKPWIGHDNRWEKLFYIDCLRLFGKLQFSQFICTFLIFSAIFLGKLVCLFFPEIEKPLKLYFKNLLRLNFKVILPI